MSKPWESRQFAAVVTPAADLAEAITRSLGSSDPAVAEVVRLHLEALDTSLALDAPELLADQPRWEQVRLRACGSSLTAADVDAGVRTALHLYLTDEMITDITDFCDRVLGELDAATVTTVDWLTDQDAKDYFEAALHGNRDEAIAIIRRRLAAGGEPVEIMLSILQPAQFELGERWESGRINVAHEHVATAITQTAMAMFYPPMGQGRDLRVVAATASGEAHEIGIRMVCDLLAQAGWSASYLGAGVPEADVVDIVLERGADVLALSASMAGHVRELRRLIDRVRREPGCQSVKILVGGRPFAVCPDLVELIGADGFAPDAATAVELCETWAATAAQGSTATG